MAPELNKVVDEYKAKLEEIFNVAGVEAAHFWLLHSAAVMYADLTVCNPETAGFITRGNQEILDRV